MIFEIQHPIPKSDYNVFVMLYPSLEITNYVPINLGYEKSFLSNELKDNCVGVWRLKK